jgi:DNA-binding NtrC family response regulator/predicted hydrocarbon binding protein
MSNARGATDRAKPFLARAREDLLSRLRFTPETGHIWLDTKRMFLLHGAALGSLRQELIGAVGVGKARGIFTRMGYQSGSRDAEVAKKIRGGLSYFERYSVGPQLHALEGVVMVEPVRVDVDVERGRHYGEFLWRDSIEAEAHVAVYGIGTEVACWMQIGYASGYASAFMGRPILYREVECQAQGRGGCRIVGKPVEEWQEAEQDLQYLRAQPFVNRAIADAAGATTELSGKGGKAGESRLLVGASAGFNIVCHAIKRVAPTDAPVLIYGESGVGKEMFARALHAESARSGKPFIAVNCAAIPEQLIEAELFGVEKGAYTGAVASRPGRFERANGGTLFLDEVACLSLPAQSKLLRAVYEGEIERVGDVRQRLVDVRIVAATNEDLREAVGQGRFREDLFYRLNVYPVHIPPLRERQEDISVLIAYFLERLSKRHRRDVPGLTDQALDLLLSYPWPGNVRELENAIERAMVLCDTEELDESSLPEKVFARKPSSSAAAPLAAPAVPGAAPGDLSLKRAHRAIEEQYIRLALRRTKGNRTRAAELLELSHRALLYKLKDYGIDADAEGQKGEGE